MIKMLRHNFIIKFISLFLAIGLWLYVMNEQNPSITNTFTVPLSVINAPDECQILHNEDSIRIRVKAPRSLFTAFDNTNIKAYVDLKNAKEGTHLETVHIKLPAGFELLSYSPEKVSFTINKVIQKSVPIDLILSGKPNSDMVVASVKQSMGSVIVEGPRNQIDTVRRAIGYIGLDGNKEDFSVIVPLRPMNDNNKEVSGVTLLNPTVNASIYLARGLTKKFVAIKPLIDSDLPKGYSIDSLSVSPAKIEISGNPQAISTINSLDTQKIPLNNVTSSCQKAVRLSLPKGITVANDLVEVDIKISKKRF